MQTLKQKFSKIAMMFIFMPKITSAKILLNHAYIFDFITIKLGLFFYLKKGFIEAFIHYYLDVKYYVLIQKIASNNFICSVLSDLSWSQINSPILFFWQTILTKTECKYVTKSFWSYWKSFRLDNSI